MGDDSAQGLEKTIGRYNDGWNDHDLDAIMSMHAPDMVFENHTAGESAQGERVLDLATHLVPQGRAVVDVEIITRHPRKVA